MFGLRIGKLGSAGTAPFSPARLFAAGEQGAWYDPSDFTTLFSDSAGTTPVTAVEQAVGLMLDKSKGLVSAAVTVTNGGFDADSDWTKGTGWSIGSGVATKSAGTAANLTQTIATTTGQWYRVTATLTRTAGGITVSLGTSGTTSGSVTAAGTYTWYILAGSSTQTLTFAADASFAGTVDNVSVNSVSGNHAYQTTSTSRPTLRARYNLLTYSEQFDNAAWTKTNVTVTANATTAPNGTTTADRLVENTANDLHNLGQQITPKPSGNPTLSIYAKADGRNWLYLNVFPASPNDFVNDARAYFDIANGTVGTVTRGNATIVSVGNGWYLCSLTASQFTSTASANGTAAIHLASANGTVSYTGDGTSGIYIWGADLRVANDGVGIPAYQRIAAATDYDTAGFPVYLDFCESFGGTNTDNSMLTNSIDFSGTDKMTVFAGVRKLSDAATAVAIDYGNSLNPANAACFGFIAPLVTSPLRQFDWRAATTGGSTAQPASTNAAYASPSTVVASGATNAAVPVTTLRLNAALVESISSTIGTSNFGSGTMHIGQRTNSAGRFSGRLYSLIVRGATTSDAQIASTEAWVNGRTKAY